MTTHESVTEWLEQLKNGDSYAPQLLWQRYVERLVRVAARKLAKAPRRVADEADVVNAAFESFLRGVEAGRFARLNDRHDLWQVLCVLTERRAVDQRRRQEALKQGGCEVRGDSAFDDQAPHPSAPQGFSDLVDSQPTPEFAAQVTDEFEHLLHQLDDEELRGIAIAKMEGYTNREIASLLDISERTVERRLSLIRQIWKAYTDERPDE